MSNRKGHAAYMEELDDVSGQVREETKVTASVASSPVKEKANSKKSRQSPSVLTDSDSTILSPRKKEKDSKSKGKEKEKDRTTERERREREREREREEKHKRTSSKPTTVTFSSKAERPVAKHSKTSPVLHHGSRGQPSESEYYGVVPESRDRTVAHRAGRSLSYHGGKPPYYPPPQSNAQFYAQQQSNAFHPSAATHAGHPQYPSSYGSSYPSPGGGMVPPSEYFDQMQQSNLKQRFETGPRSASAMGHRPQKKSLYEREYEEEPAARRKPSVKKRDVDRERMPPPPRPKTTKPTTQTVFRPPPPPQGQKPRGYDEEDLMAADASMYREVSKRRSGDYGALLPRTRRPSVLYHESSPYNALIQPSNSIRSRPNSYYGLDEYEGYSYGHGNSYGASYGASYGESYNSNYEDNLALAEAYQNHISGGLQPLTKDALQKASKRSQGGSSRSTRSSGSHDESDYKNSNTTRTTRSISGEEDLTIKVPGNTVIEVQGAKIQCRDGGEVNISSSRQTSGASRGSSSEEESTVLDERPSRIERPQYRNRAMSQSSSWSRTPDPTYRYPHVYPSNYF